jgi:FtsZ-interacting cell division protein ZipA
MSVLLIVIIVVAIIVLIGLVFGMIKGRRAAARKREERRLAKRRNEAVSEHRQVAEARTGAAEEAEHRARIATAVAERERAEARLHEERARAHELGLADDELRHERITNRGERTTREETATEDGSAGRAGDGSEPTVAQQAPAHGARTQDGDR